MNRYIAILAAVICFVGSIGASDCKEGHVHLSGPWGSAKFQVEVMDDEAERARGLMHRPQLGKFSAMLFVYERERILSFWMKNTFIALDILFFDSAGRLVNIRADAIPGDETPLRGTGPAQYVLEINAGLATALKIGSDTVLRHARLAGDEKTPGCV
jgi:hypothetical protein